MEDVNEIIPGIWLGNKEASLNQEFLQGKKITAIFNCTKDLPVAETDSKKFRIPVDDNLAEEEIRNLELWSVEAMVKLSRAHREGPVLVHCFAGMQRSAAIVAMYLIMMRSMDADSAMKYIVKRRPIAFAYGKHPNFERSIRGFEKMFDAFLVKKSQMPN
jgi:protein tyrosine/serine phosphatase